MKAIVVALVIGTVVSGAVLGAGAAETLMVAQAKTDQGAAPKTDQGAAPKTDPGAPPKMIEAKEQSGFKRTCSEAHGMCCIGDHE